MITELESKGKTLLKKVRAAQSKTERDKADKAVTKEVATLFALAATKQKAQQSELAQFLREQAHFLEKAARLARCIRDTELHRWDLDCVEAYRHLPL